MAKVQAPRLPRWPTPVGDWIEDDTGLQCRLPLKRLRVVSPPAFLRAVQAGCDGNTCWADMRARLCERWPAAEVDTCLDMLVDMGLIVEAGHRLAIEARAGWTPQPQSALPDAPAARESARLAALDRLHRPLEFHALRPSHVHLSTLMFARESVQTFGDRALPLQSVASVLWAMYGVLDADSTRVRRTVPSSGGLYGLRWFVALLRPMEGHAGGLYEVHYHANDRALSLSKLTGSSDQAWSTLLAPSVLSFAHAVIYSVADLEYVSQKYGNGALKLALLEAGHALQNGALAALGEGAATVWPDDMIEPEVLDLFQLGGQMHPLASLVLGTAPTAQEQALAQASARRVPVRAVPNHTLALPLSTRVSTAGPIAVGKASDTALWASGRTFDPRLASLKAEAEGWERIGWSTPSALECARMSDLRGAVDPRRVVAYARHQYESEDFPYTAWSAGYRYPWAKAVRARDGADAWMMAHCVYALAALEPAMRRRAYTNSSTSGVAAFTDPASARFRALMELVERDAFARAWLNRSPPPRLDESCYGHAIRLRLQDLESAGYAVSAHLLISTYLPSVAIFAQHRDAPFTSVTTAAAIGLEDALDAALAEAESRVQQVHGKPPHPPMRPHEVTLATHHGQYFNTQDGFGAADWFAESKRFISAKVLRGMTLPTSEAQLSDLLLARGYEIYVCDLTPPGASLDQGRTKLHVARVFVPGLLPIWFGHGTQPLGLLTDDLSNQGASDAQAQAQARSIHPCT